MMCDEYENIIWSRAPLLLDINSWTDRLTGSEWLVCTYSSLRTAEYLWAVRGSA